MRLFRQKKQQISRKREIRNESKEKNMDDFLLKQIDEFRDKAQQLQDLINTKETKVRELQLLVDERESKATKLQMELDERQREADSLVGNVEEQVDKLIKKIEVQQNDNTEDIKNALDGMSQDLSLIHISEPTRP